MRGQAITVPIRPIPSERVSVVPPDDHGDAMVQPPGCSAINLWLSIGQLVRRLPHHLLHAKRVGLTPTTYVAIGFGGLSNVCHLIADAEDKGFCDGRELVQQTRDLSQILATLQDIALMHQIHNDEQDGLMHVRHEKYGSRRPKYNIPEGFDYWQIASTLRVGERYHDDDYLNVR